MVNASSVTAGLIALFIVAASVRGRPVTEAAHSRALAGTTCVEPRANCDTRNPDCETNLKSSLQHCGKCGNSCKFGSFCLDGFCVPFRCYYHFFPGSNSCPSTPAGLDCQQGVCVRDSVPCGSVMLDGSGNNGIFTYVVNVGTCGPVLDARESFTFRYDAKDVPVQFTVKRVDGTVIYGPIVAGSGPQHCRDSERCPGNPYGSACMVPMHPNVPLSGPPVVLLRPRDDTRVIVEVNSQCHKSATSRWEFMVGCVLDYACVGKR